MFYAFAGKLEFVHVDIGEFRGVLAGFLSINKLLILSLQVELILYSEHFFARSHLNHIVVRTKLKVFNCSLFRNLYFQFDFGHVIEQYVLLKDRYHLAAILENIDPIPLSDEEALNNSVRGVYELRSIVPRHSISAYYTPIRMLNAVLLLFVNFKTNLYLTFLHKDDFIEFLKLADDYRLSKFLVRLQIC